MIADNLITVPTAETLLARVRDALSRASNLQWKDLTADAICSTVAERVKDDFISCYSGKPSKIPTGCDGSEWLFDFTALLYKKPLGTSRFVLQPLIVGEIEWSESKSETDYDLEKLLMVDSVVCFFIFGLKWSAVAEKRLAEYEQVICERQTYARARGTLPPRFLLACYVSPSEYLGRAGMPIVREV